MVAERVDRTWRRQVVKSLRAASNWVKGLARLPMAMERLERLERLSHGGHAVYLGNNRVLAKVMLGEQTLSFMMAADDRLLMPRVVTHGDHEPEVTRYFAETVRPTDHCLDIGANFGYFTCLMASLAYRGKTLGIEPDHETFALVRDNVFINSLEAVGGAMLAAVGEAPGQLTLFRRMTRSGNTSIIPVGADLVHALGEEPPQAFEATCVSVDSLLPSFEGRVDIMKVDVEGAEPLVFRGARETIARNPDLKIVMEWSPGQIRSAGFDVPAFLEELSALGLRGAILTPAGPEPIELAALADHIYHSGVLLTKAA